MTDINTLLKNADPAQHDEGLSPDDVQSIRREMLGAIDDPVVTVPAWRRPLTIAAAAAVILGVGGVLEHRNSSTGTGSHESTGSPVDTGSSDMPRQLQFATPGGTRIIWIFDQHVRLQESMP